MILRMLTVTNQLLRGACLMLFLLSALLTTVLCAAPLHQDRTTQADGPLRISTGIAPLAFLLERIGGDRVHVETLLPEGQDPHLFEPGPRLLHRLSGTQLYLMAGLPFERMVMKKIRGSNSLLNIVDMAAMIGLPKAGLEHHNCSDHAHDSHDHTGIDPHFWLGPPQLREFINAAARILADTDPAHAAGYERNALALIATIDAVDTRNREMLAPYRNRTIFVFHPAFGYFTHAYGLHQQAVETGGSQPGARQMAEIIRLARAADVRTVFVQPQFDTKSAQTVAAAINGRVVSLDPLAANIIENLATIARIIAGSFKQPDSPEH
jgi:zinc transport system substrate-binding protein